MWLTNIVCECYMVKGENHQNWTGPCIIVRSRSTAAVRLSKRHCNEEPSADPNVTTSSHHTVPKSYQQRMQQHQKESNVHMAGHQKTRQSCISSGVHVAEQQRTSDQPLSDLSTISDHSRISNHIKYLSHKGRLLMQSVFHCLVRWHQS